jgi:hypothetical protein
MWDHELVAGVADYLEENLAAALVAHAYTAPVAVHREYVDPYHLDHVPALVLQLLTYQYRQIDQIAGERRFVISVFWRRTSRRGPTGIADPRLGGGRGVSRR